MIELDGNALESPGDVVPKILDWSVIDRRVHVRVEDAWALCQSLAKQGLFVGQ